MLLLLAATLLVSCSNRIANSGSEICFAWTPTASKAPATAYVAHGLHAFCTSLLTCLPLQPLPSLDVWRQLYAHIILTSSTCVVCNDSYGALLQIAAALSEHDATSASVLATLRHYDIVSRPVRPAKHHKSQHHRVSPGCGQIWLIFLVLGLFRCILW